MPSHQRRIGAAIFVLTGVAFVGLSLAMVFDVLGLQMASPTAEKQAIRKVLDDQTAAWNRGDLNSFMAGYSTGELVYVSPKGKKEGWQTLLAHYQQSYQAEGKMGQLKFDDLEIDLVGPRTSWARGKWQVVTDKETFAGHFTLVLRKQKDGWRIVHDHTT